MDQRLIMRVLAGNHHHVLELDVGDDDFRVGAGLQPDFRRRSVLVDCPNYRLGGVVQQVEVDIHSLRELTFDRTNQQRIRLDRYDTEPGGTGDIDSRHDDRIGTSQHSRVKLRSRRARNAGHFHNRAQVQRVLRLVDAIETDSFVTERIHLVMTRHDRTQMCRVVVELERHPPLRGMRRPDTEQRYVRTDRYRWIGYGNTR